MLPAAVSQTKEALISLPLPSCPHCMHTLICFLLALSDPCPPAFAVYVQHRPPDRCLSCSQRGSWGTWCAQCCVPLSVFVPASGVQGLLLPHAAMYPPDVRSSVPCSSGQVASAS